MTQQIRIFKGPEEINLVDKVSKVLDAIFNESDLNDQFMNGVYTIPPKPLHEIMQGMNPQINYLCDSIFEDGSKKIPQIYRWREWGARAEQLITGLNVLELKIMDNSKEIENVL